MHIAARRRHCRSTSAARPAPPSMTAAIGATSGLVKTASAISNAPPAAAPARSAPPLRRATIAQTPQTMRMYAAGSAKPRAAHLA